jgi:hypothetical protein
MQGVQRATQYGYSLYEFEIYNSATTPKLTVSATAGANGTISPAGQVGVLLGASPTFTAVPAAGFGIGAMTVDGQPIGVQSSYTFSDVNVAHSINVSFVSQSASINLALNKVATASGEENGGVPPAAAVDGDPTTRWSSDFNDKAWITVDLGSEQTFNRVVFLWENAHANAYQIQTSHDNADWSNTVYTQNASKGGVEDFTFPTTTARYIRMQGVQRSSQYGYSLYEFQVYDNDTTTPTGPTSPTQATFIEQPAVQTVPVGQSGHFAVVMAGTGPYTYQWLRGTQAVAGATTRSFDTPPTTAADDGSVYSVNVTGPDGTVSTSSTAKLSVNSAKLSYTVTPGYIGIDLANNTQGAYTDDQVYVVVIGRDPVTNNFVWLNPDGTFTPMTVADNNAANHLSAGGQNYPNHGFSLAQSKTLLMPAMSSGRLYVSLGSPLYIAVNQDVNGNIGFAGPSPQNPADPNENINFDWYEFSNGVGGLWINTTQVDEFGFPLTEDVYAQGGTWHQQTGITQHRADLIAAYAKEVPSAFQPVPTSPHRIMSPGLSTFAAGQPNSTYFDAYINEAWTYYASHDFVVTVGARQFVGRTQGDTIVFNEVNLNNGAFGGEVANIGKPTTTQVIQDNGPFATGTTMEQAIEAQIGAAFNRHVVEDVTKWNTPSAWYAASPSNEYARFWHDHNISGLAYGFSFDDVDNQSSTIQSPNPEHMVLGIGW